MLSVVCTKCPRTGRLSKARLLSEWGDIGLVDLLQVIGKDCPQQVRDHQNVRRCGIRYEGLVGLPSGVVGHCAGA